MGVDLWGCSSILGFAVTHHVLKLRLRLEIRKLGDRCVDEDFWLGNSLMHAAGDGDQLGKGDSTSSNRSSTSCWHQIHYYQFFPVGEGEYSS